MLKQIFVKGDFLTGSIWAPFSLVLVQIKPVKISRLNKTKVGLETASIDMGFHPRGASAMMKLKLQPFVFLSGTC